MISTVRLQHIHHLAWLPFQLKIIYMTFMIAVKYFIVLECNSLNVIDLVFFF